MTTPFPVETNASAAPRLGLWDAVSLVIGIVVGTSIFRTAPEVFQNTSGPWPALGAWLLGGVLSIIGALCYAELATTYTRAGGDYEYLTRAFGPWAGFLFGWAQLTAVLTSSIGTMAYTFADYGVRLFRLTDAGTVWLAATPIRRARRCSMRWGRRSARRRRIFARSRRWWDWSASCWPASQSPIGATWRRATATRRPPAESADEGRGWQAFGLAMVFVLYAYGGWNDAAFVAAEVRDRRRNSAARRSSAACSA